MQVSEWIDGLRKVKKTKKYDKWQQMALLQDGFCQCGRYLLLLQTNELCQMGINLRINELAIAIFRASQRVPSLASDFELKSGDHVLI